MVVPERVYVVITFKDKLETGQQILETVRNTIKTKKEGIRIESVRNAKDRKVIIGCRRQKND